MIQQADSEKKFMKNLRSEDEILRSKAAEVTDWRKNSGLDGLVGGMQAIIINTEPELHQTAVEELLRYTEKPKVICEQLNPLQGNRLNFCSLKLKLEEKL